MNLIMNWIRKIIQFFKILHLIYRYGLDAILKDPLTGVFSKFLLDEFGKIEIRRAERYGLPLCIIMLDFDNLKEINDTEGHDAGDRALVKVVRVFKKIFCRATDIFIRVGGDEFLIILVNTSESAVKELLKKVPKELKKIFLSASTGSYFWEKDMTFGQLMKKADDNLYIEKNSKKKKPDAI